MTRRLIVGLVVAVVVLGGCSEKQQASESLPTASSTPTEEALPPLGPEELPVPDEARTQDAAGAEAFARYYVELLNHQQAIPAGGPIRDLGPDCNDCQRIAQRLDEAAENGWKVDGGQVSIIGGFGTALDSESAHVTFIARVEAVAIYDSAGSLVPETTYPTQERLPSALSLDWSRGDSSWLVSGSNFG